MRWFRTNTPFGARLALIALALQLVLTFGHVHAPSAAGPTTLQASQGGTAPQDRNHNGLADTDCPTCALIQLSAMSAPSVAPELPLPVAFDFVTLQSRIEIAAASAPEAPFQARAPPVA
jgi:hypothetical protein